MRNDWPSFTTIREKRVFSQYVRGTPKGQPRPRAFVRGGRASVYEAGTAEGWKAQVAAACAKIEGARFAGPLLVKLVFYMPRPKGHFRTNGDLKANAPLILHTSKPDVDNLAKSVLDALTGIHAWTDDDQVCALNVRRYYESARNGQQDFPPGCQLVISQLIEKEVAL